MCTESINNSRADKMDWTHKLGFPPTCPKCPSFLSSGLQPAIAAQHALHCMEGDDVEEWQITIKLSSSGSRVEDYSEETCPKYGIFMVNRFRNYSLKILIFLVLSICQCTAVVQLFSLNVTRIAKQMMVVGQGKCRQKSWSTDLLIFYTMLMCIMHTGAVNSWTKRWRAYYERAANSRL